MYVFIISAVASRVGTVDFNSTVVYAMWYWLMCDINMKWRLWMITITET